MSNVLVVLTNVDYYEPGFPTGTWFGEIVHFYKVMRDAHCTIDFVSPKGGDAPLDPLSIVSTLLDDASKKAYENEHFRARLQHTLSPDQVDPEKYSAIYFSGGHGICHDVAHCTRLLEIASQIHKQGGIIAAVCSGSYVLPFIDGGEFLRGKQLTGLSSAELRAINAPYDPSMLVEGPLSESVGATYKRGSEWKAFVVMDDNLITGQNPASAAAVGRQLVRVLNRHQPLVSQI